MTLEHLDKELKDDGIVFLAYDGFLTQALIVAMTEALERESDTLNKTTSTNILTIFIELTQNMMNYSKSQKALRSRNDGKGMILVGHDKGEDQYYVLSKNLINEVDKKHIEENLNTVSALSPEELRKYYREMRKLGHDKHEKGAGIGFIEIARKCEKMTYAFKKVDDVYSFTLKAVLKKEKNAKFNN